MNHDESSTYIPSITHFPLLPQASPPPSASASSGFPQALGETIMVALLPLFFNPLALSSVLIHVALSSGSVKTAIIDDTTGDSNTGAQPVYTGTFSSNSDCSSCVVHPDPSEAHGGTWHDSSQFNGAPAIGVTLSFTGTGIDVFCILANTLPNTDTITSLAITLDGSPQQPFLHTPDSSSSYVYNAKVFSTSGLSQGPHEVVLLTNRPEGSLLLFDYAQYTFEVADPPPPAPPPTTTITTGVTSIVTHVSTKQVTQSQKPTTPSSSPADGASSISSPNNAAGSNAPLASSATAGEVSAAHTTVPEASTASDTPPSIGASGAASSKKPSHVGLIVGILVPVLLLLAAFIFFCRRRLVRRNNADKEAQDGLSARPFTAWSGSNTVSSLPRRQPVFGPNRAANHAVASGHERYASQCDDSSGEWDSSVPNTPSTTQEPSYNAPLPPGPPSASIYTFDLNPPPLYSEQQSPPAMPSIPSMIPLPPSQPMNEKLRRNPV
ncbi:hypothetical protein R3P38DRAFT_3211197 [Favolaschia claudopus]|uniref:Uncharacterized protein n=1 Tax=Favolaschia claudopus TaxID=2862362 RepID=A0AAW0AGR8_9AGAR